MDIINTAKQIGEILKEIYQIWDGRKAILEMKNAGYPHWRQMEWIGFYFQFLCERFLSNFMDIPGPQYGRVEFDAFKNIPWDFKAHATNTRSQKIIVNDSEATANGIKDYGAVGLILAIGEVSYNDENRIFQKWHEKIKGGKSKYVLDRIKRGTWSRIRKVSFNLQNISFIRINDNTLVRSGSFQEDFRNAGGQPRRAKVLLDLKKIDRELVYFIEY